MRRDYTLSEVTKEIRKLKEAVEADELTEHSVNLQFFRDFGLSLFLAHVLGWMSIHNDRLYSIDEICADLKVSKKPIMAALDTLLTYRFIRYDIDKESTIILDAAEHLEFTFLEVQAMRPWRDNNVLNLVKSRIPIIEDDKDDDDEDF